MVDGLQNCDADSELEDGMRRPSLIMEIFIRPWVKGRLEANLLRLLVREDLHCMPYVRRLERFAGW